MKIGPWKFGQEKQFYLGVIDLIKKKKKSVKS